MKFRTLAKWDAPSLCHGLVYFAQILEEMLFEFSLDTYKPSVLHTGLLCKEAAEVISDIERGIIKEPNLWHVLDELCKNLESDPVAKNLLPLSINSIFPALRNKSTPIGQIKAIVDLLIVNLQSSKYREKTEELLYDEVSGARRHSEIRRLARSYVTHLISQGYHPSFIRESALSFFWYGSNRISNDDALKDFFVTFPTDQSSYEVLFKVDRNFETLGDCFSGLEIFFSRTLPADIDVSSFPDFKSLRGEHLFAVVKDVEAKDIFSARERAESRLAIVATLQTIYRHSSLSRWNDYCLVKDVKSGTYRKVRKPRTAMQKRADPPPQLALTRLRALVSGFSLEKDSFAKFHRSAQLHSMALGSDSQENQILNIWIALESLVPSETKSSESSNIEHISSSLMSFLSISYIENLLGNLAKDLLRWNSRLARALLKKVKGKKVEEKLARMLIMEEYREVRAELEVATRDFYLLRDRLEYFKSTLSSPLSVANALDNHSKRLEWQIRRIYRARNIIVHSGRTPKYTRALIEHAHDYLDTILTSLVTLASKPKTINSVPQGFKFVQLRYSEYLRNLKEKGAAFDDENIENLMFGLRRKDN